MGGGNVESPHGDPSACFSQEGSPAGEQTWRGLPRVLSEQQLLSLPGMALFLLVSMVIHKTSRKAQLSFGKQIIGCDGACGWGRGDNPTFILSTEFRGWSWGLPAPPSWQGKHCCTVPKRLVAAQSSNSCFSVLQAAIGRFK